MAGGFRNFLEYDVINGEEEDGVYSRIFNSGQGFENREGDSALETGKIPCIGQGPEFFQIPKAYI